MLLRYNKLVCEKCHTQFDLKCAKMTRWFYSRSRSVFDAGLKARRTQHAAQIKENSNQQSHYRATKVLFSSPRWNVMGNDITHTRVPSTVKNKTTTAIPAKGEYCILYFYYRYFFTLKKNLYDYVFMRRLKLGFNSAR